MDKEQKHLIAGWLLWEVRETAARVGTGFIALFVSTAIIVNALRQLGVTLPVKVEIVLIVGLSAGTFWVLAEIIENWRRLFHRFFVKALHKE
jgi:hypothetical protein